MPFQTPFKEIEAEIYELTTNNRVASFFVSTRLEGEPFNIGDNMSFRDSSLYKNNSLRIRRCLVKRIEKLSPQDGLERYNLYVVAVSEERTS